MSTITVKIDLEVTDKHCADILCTALEGGIGYWAQARKIVRTPDPEFEREGFMDYVSCEIAELNDDESGYDWKHPKRLNYETIRRGIERICNNNKLSHMAGGIISDIREDRMGCYIDANVADVIVQFGLFNEERYS